MAVTVDGKMGNNVALELDEVLASKYLMDTLMKGDFNLLAISFDEDRVRLFTNNHLDDLIEDSVLLTSTLPINNQDDTLLIFIFPDEKSDLITADILDLFDFALPANSQLLNYQLNKIITAKQENHRLRQEIAHHKRKNKEIEVIKNAIVRNVSHELRTPLLQVKSAVSLICEESSDISLNNYAQNAVARLETHIKNITMLGHSLDINVNPIVLHDSIDSAKRNLTRIWTYRNETPSIQIDLEKSLPPVMADKQGLGTVFQLLMDNALKFSDNQEIKITGRKVRDKVRVAIHDNGIGIADDKVKDIFDSFYQIDATSTRPYGGAGVGLALVKLILDYHGIDIHVDSEMKKGSTFWFDIPSVDLDSLK